LIVWWWCFSVFTWSCGYSVRLNGLSQFFLVPVLVYSSTNFIGFSLYRLIPYKNVNVITKTDMTARDMANGDWRIRDGA
jgi:hypothetical protein